MARKVPVLAEGQELEVSTASGWVPVVVEDERTALLRRTDVPEGTQWYRFYLGQRGYRVPERNAR